MAGIQLYVLTLIIEALSIACRFVLVVFLASIFWSRETALLVGSVVAAAPIVYSLLILAGIPSGHLLTRWSLGARAPDSDEDAVLDWAFRQILANDAQRPQHVFMQDDPGPNAAVSGTSLFVQHELISRYRSYLPAILAHELGHLHGRDGQLSLALRALVIPGAFLLSGLLLKLLGIVVDIIIVMLNAMIRLLSLWFLVGVLQVLLNVFLITIPQYIIIFAMGGVGPKLLSTFWSNYFINREYHADAYATRLGQGPKLIEFFRRYAVLDEVEIPWSRQRTHPPTQERLVRLVAGIQQEPRVQQSVRRPPPSATLRRRPATAVPIGKAGGATGATVWLLSALIMLIVLIGAVLFARSDNRFLAWPGQPSAPALVTEPTPTLGVPLSPD